MAAATWTFGRAAVWRSSPRDALLVALAVLHGAVLASLPAAPVVAVGLWWNANTIAHNFIHRPFFRAAWANRLFSAGLSLLLGIPQTLWRERHLAHHAGVPWRLRVSAALVRESALVFGLWTTLTLWAPRFFLWRYLPGYAAGLALCALQGYWEHAAGRPTSHYGRLYNFLCFNDGYHAEHHARPAMHWSLLPSRVESGAAESPWPPLLRWLNRRPLELLERLVLGSPPLQRFVLRAHRRALRKLLPAAHRVAIVGGGLYPRTALILRELLPAARLVIVEADADNLETARAFLPAGIECRRSLYRCGQPSDADLTIFPLCLEGDREAIYRCPPSPAVLVHDWIWRPRGQSAIVSLLLLKRLNLVRQ